MINQPEVWQRGPLPGVPPLLQPVAHALLQACEEVKDLAPQITNEILHRKPAGMASPAFHLKHLSGVIDRLFTYASGEALDSEQLAYLEAEEKILPADDPSILVTQFEKTVDAAISQLKETSEASLPANRAVGRKQIPSTVIGLLFHAAEHSMRHVGQLTVTVRVLNAAPPGVLI